MKHRILKGTLALFLAVFFSVQSAFSLGNDTPENWEGVASYISSGFDFTRVADDQRAFVQTDDDVWALTVPYGFHGYLDGSHTEDGLIGGSSLDELYFETTNGQPAIMEFNYTLDVAMDIIDPTQSVGEGAHFKVSLFGEHKVLDIFELVLKSEEQAAGMSFYVEQYETLNAEAVDTWNIGDKLLFDNLISLSTDGRKNDPFASDDPDYSGLVESGTYLPTTIQVIAFGGNGNVVFDFSDSFLLNQDDPYSIYDADGLELLPSMYTMESALDFGRTTSAPPVPEPASALLLASALLGMYFKKQ